MPASEFEIGIGQRVIRGCRWNPDAPIKVVALHGWLDNAGTFAAMAPFFEQISLTAIDLPGQGRSDPRGVDGSYDLPSELRDLHQLVEQISADQPVNLLGHSRGGVIAGLFAALFPQRVARLMMIDAVEPFRSNIAGLPDSLAESITQSVSLAERPSTAYPSREAALEARMNALTSVSRSGAEFLAERALQETDRGWCWRADQRLKGTSGFRLTEEMRQDFYSRITAPSLLVEPLNGMMHKEKRFAGAGEFIHGLERINVPGGHHCHLDDCPEKVAEIADDWFAAGTLV